MKDTVGQRDQMSVWDQGEGCGREMAAVGQRGKAQSGGSSHGIEKTGMSWRELSYGRQDGHRTRGFLVGQRVLSQDGVNGDGGIPLAEDRGIHHRMGGEHHGMDGIQGTIMGWRVQQQVAVPDSLCLGGRKPVHPAGGQSAGCQ